MSSRSGEGPSTVSPGGIAAGPYAMLVLVMALWGSNVIIGRFMAGSWSPYALSLWRWGLALTTLLPFAGGALWRYRAILARQFRQVVILGVLSVGMFNTLLYVALNYTTAINVALINSTTPIVILLMTRFMMGTPMAPRTIAGVTLGLVGAATIVVRGNIEAALSLQFNFGDMLQMLAVIVWALYSVLLQRNPVPVPALALQLAMTMIGLPLVLLAFLVMPSHGAIVPRQALDLGVLVYLAVAVSLGATLLWNLSIGRVGARVAGFFNYLTPPIVALMSVVVLGERLESFHAAGFALILVGILLATLRSIGRMSGRS